MKVLLLSLCLAAAQLVGAAPAIELSNSSTPDEQRVYVETNYGDFILKLHALEAPNAVNQFKNLVDLGLYNGVNFTAVAPSYYVQLDDVSGRRGGLSSLQEQALAPIAVEESGYTHTRGAVSLTSYENNGPASSAFTVFMGPGEDVDGKQTVIGLVEKGMEVFGQIEKLATRDGNSLKEPVQILSATLLAPSEATQKFQIKKQSFLFEKILHYALLAFLLIIVLAVLNFVFYGKLSPRSLLAFVMIIAFVGIFSAIIILHQFIGASSWGGIILLLSIIAMFKFLNRFESQKS